MGVITAIGPVHVEQVGSLEGVAQAKGELLVGLRDGATAVVPAGEELLGRWLRPELSVVTFGPGGDVELEPGADAVSTHAIHLHDRAGATTSSSTCRSPRRTTCATRWPPWRRRGPWGCARGPRRRALLGAARRARRAPGGAVVINDCYNANPLSMRAALDDLSLQEPARRRVAVLGDMLELGADEREHHRQIGA